MKVAIVAANGRAGRMITQEALDRGLDVTVIVRHENKTAADKVIAKDLFALTEENLREFDVVVDAFGNFNPETLDQHESSLKHLTDILSRWKTRLIVVGGAGSLFVDKEHTQMLSETPDFPEAVKPLATAMGNALMKLRQRKDVDWVYISPAADFQADGARVGSYGLAGEELATNAAGESKISYGDYAIAVVDEIVSGGHHQERISVYQK